MASKASQPRSEILKTPWFEAIALVEKTAEFYEEIAKAIQKAVSGGKISLPTSSLP